MSRRQRMVIITGDDFGLSIENNAGITTAHQHGVLSAASSMVGGDAVSEAVDYAHQHPSLAVGLHVSFSDTRPILPPDRVPLLVQSNGYFPSDDTGYRTALKSIAGRRQIRAEIAAQFKAFHETNLPFDHVDSHRHAHRHPLIAWMMFREAARWNVRATRVPWDAVYERQLYGNAKYPLRYARQMVLRRLGAYYKLKAPDRTINRPWATQQFVEYLAALPVGTTEIFFHPVTTSEHLFAEDLPMLLRPEVRAALTKLAKS